MKKESTFKTELRHRIEEEFPGAMVMHLDPTDKKGIPDLIVLHKDKWAVLEGKRHSSASHRLHQDYYIDKMGQMGYASFVFPENADEVIEDLHCYFG